MGLAVKAPLNHRIPKPTRLVLTCDMDHGFGNPTKHIFRRGTFGDQYARAMRRGWKEIHRNGKRVFICPDCSGKSKEK